MDLDPPPGEMSGGPVPLTGILAARAPGSPAVDRDADRAVAVLYAAHYRPLVRLAALLGGDVAAAEEVVQESFVAMHGGWRRLRDTDRALSYLRQSVVSRCRSLPERCAVVAALRALSLPEREALVLRHYAGLSEAQIASAMGISRGAVRCHTARARLALRAVLDTGHESRVTVAHPPGSEQQRDSDVAAEHAEAGPRRQR
jgi:DNA-directed RNA polymerase specialized sigma24 family protein